MLPFLVLAMVLCLAAYWYQTSKYSQQELEQEEQDERNRMLRERTSWLCWQGETVLSTVCFLFVSFVFKINSSVLLLVCGLHVARWLIYETVYRRLDKKY